MLELRLLRAGVKVAYAEDVLVFDEKVQDKKTFTNQRSRWIATQFEHIRHGLSMLGTALRQGNKDLLLKILNDYKCQLQLILVFYINNNKPIWINHNESVILLITTQLFINIVY